MIKRIPVVAFLLFLAVSAVQGQTITLSESRSGLLDGMESTLANVDREASTFGDVLSPFVPRVKKKIEPIQTKQLDNVQASTGAELLPDSVALRMIAQQFRPLGSLVIGNRGVLQLANGQTIAKGDSFKAEIQGNVYEITVLEVTSQGYTLALGSAELNKTFLTTTGVTQ